MSFWEAVALVGTMATILGVFITVYGLINNRVLKQEAAGIREILLRVEFGQKEARQEMAEAIRHLGDLIKLDGEKTRETVRAKA